MKIALAGLICFLAGFAWIAVVFALIFNRASTPGIGVIVGVPRAAEVLCLVGLALCLFALVKTIRRRFNA